MTETRFWLIRHALVDENARAILYGVMDVPLCETTLESQAPMYAALARRLPRPAVWKVTPLSRTRAWWNCHANSIVARPSQTAFRPNAQRRWAHGMTPSNSTPRMPSNTCAEGSISAIGRTDAGSTAIG